MIISIMSKLFLFFFNEVEYYITNYIITFQKEKQRHWKQIWKRKRFRKCLLSGGSGSTGRESRSGSAQGGSETVAINL
jgi:hypothetical protein